MGNFADLLLFNIISLCTLYLNGCFSCEQVLEIRKLKLENLKVPKGNKKLLTDQNVCKIVTSPKLQQFLCLAAIFAVSHFRSSRYLLLMFKFMLIIIGISFFIAVCKACSLACLKCPFCRTKIADRIFTFNCWYFHLTLFVNEGMLNFLKANHSFR